MGILVSDQEIRAWDADFQMGRTWANATDTERIQAVDTAESIWQALNWAESPFDNVDVRDKLLGVLVMHSRDILETRGSAGDGMPEHVEMLLSPYISQSLLSFGADVEQPVDEDGRPIGEGPPGPIGPVGPAGSSTQFQFRNSVNRPPAASSGAQAVHGTLTRASPNWTLEPVDAPRGHRTYVQVLTVSAGRIFYGNVIAFSGPPGFDAGGAGGGAEYTTIAYSSLFNVHLASTSATKEIRHLGQPGVSTTLAVNDPERYFLKKNTLQLSDQFFENRNLFGLRFTLGTGNIQGIGTSAQFRNLPGTVLDVRVMPFTQEYSNDWTEFQMSGRYNVSTVGTEKIEEVQVIIEARQTDIGDQQNGLLDNAASSMLEVRIKEINNVRQTFFRRGLLLLIDQVVIAPNESLTETGDDVARAAAATAQQEIHAHETASNPHNIKIADVDQEAILDAAQEQRTSADRGKALIVDPGDENQLVLGTPQSATPSGPSGPTEVADGSITEQKLADGAVTTRKLADDAITQDKMADDSVGGRELKGDSVANGHIVDGAIDERKIENNAVTGRKIAADAVERGHLAANAVGTQEVEDGSVTRDKLDTDVRSALAGDSAITVVKRWARGSDNENLAQDLENAMNWLFQNNFILSDLPGMPDFAAADDGKILQIRISNDEVSLVAVDKPTGGRGSGSVTLTDESVLDLAQSSRDSSDRGKALVVSGSDEDALALKKIDPAAWAVDGNTSVAPKTKIPNVVEITDSINPATIQGRLSGEKSGNIVIGYNTQVVVFFQYRQAPTNAFVEIARVPRGSGTIDTAAVNARIAAEVAAWAIESNADGIPGTKTYDGLFKSESETEIAGANARIAFDVGNASDESVVDETDAEDTSFVITAEQANEADGFLRVRWTVGGTQVSKRPTDVELLLQVRDTGAVIAKHNLPLTGASVSGTAQFPVGDAGAKRWAVRIVTAGSYKGEVIIEEAKFHSSQSLADPAIEHVVHPIVNKEAEERQEEDARLLAEIKRVEKIEAIVNGLPSPTISRKGAISWRTDRPYEQTVADAFQVPDGGFVQFILGNIGATGIMPTQYCMNRKQIVYAQGNHEIALNFNADRKAIVTAINARNNKLSTLSSDIANTATGLLMLHWAAARASGVVLPHPPEKAAEVKLYDLQIAKDGTPSWAETGAAGADDIPDVPAANPAGTHHYAIARKSNGDLEWDQIGFGILYKTLGRQPLTTAAGARASNDWTAATKPPGIISPGTSRLQITNAFVQNQGPNFYGLLLRLRASGADGDIYRNLRIPLHSADDTVTTEIGATLLGRWYKIVVNVDIGVINSGRSSNVLYTIRSRDPKNSTPTIPNLNLDVVAEYHVLGADSFLD